MRLPNSFCQPGWSSAEQGPLGALEGAEGGLKGASERGWLAVALVARWGKELTEVLAKAKWDGYCKFPRVKALFNGLSSLSPPLSLSLFN